MQSDHDVLEHTHALEYACALERSRQTERRHLMRLEVAERRSTILELSLRRPKESRDHIKCGGLTGSVRSNQANHFTLIDDEAHVLDRDQSTEMNRDVLDRQNRLRQVGGVRAHGVSRILAWKGSAFDAILGTVNHFSMAGTIP